MVPAVRAMGNFCTTQNVDIIKGIIDCGVVAKLGANLGE